jgi:PEP-CTERM motif-containing protein
MHLKPAMIVCLMLGAGLLSVPVTASPIVFSGSDNGANSTDPRPGSNAAAAAFDVGAGALGTLNLVTFETAAVGTFNSLVVAPGVTLTGTDFTGDSSGQSIRNAPFSTPDSLFGYNTTSGGSRFAFFNGGFLTLSFATPVQAFGGYFSGIQLAGETITFNDGSSQTVPIPTLSSGIAFVGFTDVGQSILSIRLDTTSAANPLGDFVGFDDFRYVNAGAVAAVPEPASLLLLGSGLIGVARRRYTRKRTTAVI